MKITRLRSAIALLAIVLMSTYAHFAHAYDYTCACNSFSGDSTVSGQLYVNQAVRDQSLSVINNKASGGNVTYGIMASAWLDPNAVGVVGSAPIAFYGYGRIAAGKFETDATTGAKGLLVTANGASGYGAYITETASGSTGIYVSSPTTGAVFASTAATGTAYGLRSSCVSNNCTAVYASAPTGQTAAYLSGNVVVSGTTNLYGPVNVTGYLSKGGGGFRIDHPEKPETHYLNHGFVESDVSRNLYTGEATFDAAGNATVTMPSWYTKVNARGRLFLDEDGVAKTKLADGQWKLRGKAGQTVGWFVIATRDDAFIRARQPATEMVKPIAGRYVHPELFGKSAVASTP